MIHVIVTEDNASDYVIALPHLAVAWAAIQTFGQVVARRTGRSYEGKEVLEVFYEDQRSLAGSAEEEAQPESCTPWQRGYDDAREGKGDFARRTYSALTGEREQYMAGRRAFYIDQLLRER